MRRQLALFPLATRRTLVLFEIRLELVRSFELARLESVLIGTETTIGRREPRLEVVVDVVESDSERCAAGEGKRSARKEETVCVKRQRLTG
jgi:hypothetical protein